ncbi:MAG: response regulator, partial [Euryarchaeota archaeon]|nr:response regulator [Euryarchaeota archaeon]
MTGDNKKKRKVHCLLVEDNPAHAHLVQEGLAEVDSRMEVTVVEDGAAALAHLRDKSDDGPPPPDVILLDLNLPKKNGREVLSELKNDPALSHIPVVVLTTSDAEEDIRQCYDLQASCYLVKPFDLDAFMDLMAAFDRFW